MTQHTSTPSSSTTATVTTNATASATANATANRTTSRAATATAAANGTTTPARRGRPGNDRGDVITAAVRLFNQHGYEATTVGMIAEQLGVSKSAIYHHVSSKEELLASALDRALSSLEGMLAEANASGQSPVDRLELVLRGTVRVLIDELESVTLLLRLRGNTDLEREALERRRSFNVAVSSLVTEADDTGALRADIEPAVATRYVFGMVNSIIDWYRPEGALNAEQIGDQIVGLVFNGLRPRSS